MRLEEKAGLMVGPSLQMGPNGTPSDQPTYGVNPFAGGPPGLVSPATRDALYNRHLVQFINRENVPPRTMATWLNAVQELAEGRRLGTPVLFVTNPRNFYGTSAQFGVAEAASAFSQWPGPLGLAARRDRRTFRGLDEQREFEARGSRIQDDNRIAHSRTPFGGALTAGMPLTPPPFARLHVAPARRARQCRMMRAASSLHPRGSSG